MEKQQYQFLDHYFKQSAISYPNTIAIEQGAKKFTYAETNVLANRFAHYLIEKGVGPEEKVVILLPRCAEVYIMMLGVLKAGGAYIPLDPEVPAERLNFIMEDSEAKVLITSNEILNKIAQDLRPQPLFNINEQWESLKSWPDTEPAMKNRTPNDLCYIIYTSGTTGKPKGVLLEHRNVTNYIQGAQTIYPVNSTYRALQGFSVSFDASMEEIWVPFSVGATIVVGTYDIMRSGDQFATLINQLNINFLSCTPTLLSMVDEDIPSLKILIFGGEVCSSDLAHRWCKSGRLVFNTYGPTEATVIATYSLLNSSCTVTIGKSLPGYDALIVNDKLEPVAENEEGEILLGGESIARGYLHMDDLTAQKFLETDQFKGIPERYYRTGDIARYTPDGEINYLGRIDSQVKIRGFRIEPGEIESALKQYKTIRDNVVIVREDTPGDKRLIAYIIGRDNQETDIPDLRKFLKTKIPDYMVPSAFVFIDQFPLTSGGKIDRKALPAPFEAAQDFTKIHIEPQTDIEKKLAGIWSDVLKIKRIGIDENFFDIGGHSILAVRLMIRIEKDLGVRLPLATFIDHCNIKDMAGLIANKVGPGMWGSLIPIRPGGTKPPLYLVHGAGLNLLLYTTIVSHMNPEQPVFGLQAKGLDGIDEPLDTIEKIAAYYNEEILKTDKSGSYSLAGFSMGGHIAYEMARQLVSLNYKVSFLGVFDTVSDDASDRHLPLGQRIAGRMIRLHNQIIWNAKTFFKKPANEKEKFFASKLKSIIQKITKDDYKLHPEGVSDGKQSELPKYLHRVHKANDNAINNYILPEYSGKLHLFRALDQTFYIKDPVAYGWAEYVKGGVFILDIPGSHSRIFAPPNDKYFAHALQRCMDERDYLCSIILALLNLSEFLPLVL